jgi:hypothetical protein
MATVARQKLAEFALKRVADAVPTVELSGDKIDTSSELSFPASDPPSWTALSRIGVPCQNEVIADRSDASAPMKKRSEIDEHQRRDFVVHPELHVRGEPARAIRSADETRRTIQSLDDAIEYVREHKKDRDLADRERLIHQLENACMREQMLDAINAFRTWLEREDLLFPD